MRTASARTIWSSTFRGKLDFARVETGGGNVTATALSGRVEIETGGGTIHVDDIGGEVRAETGGGTIDVGTVGGDVSSANRRRQH